jgi:proteasome accessory factor A
MLESGWCDRQVVLADPLEALTVWGHDPDLRSVAPLADGRNVTAAEHQQMFAAAARRFVEAGEAEHVPEAKHILSMWQDTLSKLACRNFKSLARRLDWVMKRTLLERLIDRNPELDWRSDAVRAADLLFANLDPAEGLYWAIEAAGGVERLVTEGDIRHAMREPPADTRAWARTHLLRQVARDDVESVNWDEIRLRAGMPGSAATVIRFDDPRRFTRAEMQQLFEHARIGADESAVEALSNEPEEGQAA